MILRTLRLWSRRAASHAATHQCRSVAGLLTAYSLVPASKFPSLDRIKEKGVAQQIALAEMAIKSGNYEKAEGILQAALRISDTTHTVGVICVYDMLATLAYRQGEVNKAENILVKVLEKLSDMGMASDHNTIVSYSLKLARIYSCLGQNSLAEMGFRNCVSMQKKKYISGQTDEETGVLWLNSLFWYGKFLMSRGKHSEAKECFDSAYGLSAHMKSIETSQVMVILYNLAEVDFAVGNLDGAIKHLLNAVILGKNSKSPDLPAFYTKLGIVYLHKGVLNEARLWCETGRYQGKKENDKRVTVEAEDCIYKILKLQGKT